jgi:hypothetical protein
VPDCMIARTTSSVPITTIVIACLLGR